MDNTLYDLTMKKATAKANKKNYEERKKALDKALSYSTKNHDIEKGIKGRSNDVVEYLSNSITEDGEVGCKTVIDSVGTSLEGSIISTSSKYSPAIDGLQYEIARCEKLIESYNYEFESCKRDINNYKKSR